MDADAEATAKAERKAARKAEKKRKAEAGEPSPAKKDKKKKRKASEDEEKPKKKTKKKAEDAFYEGMDDSEPTRPRTRSVCDQDEESKEALKTAPAGSKALQDFSLSSVTREALKVRGVKVLFPIQVATFATIFYEKKDLMARARTGTGKTLAFALPIIEALLLGKSTREPRALVLAPTRELAQQVLGDFAEISRNRLKTLCVYGGSAYGPSCDALRRGVDVVVGTPGRTMDLIEKNVLQLSQLKFAVLDEADQMLDMGFKDELEKIFAGMGKGVERQLLLFSATLPPWVKKIAGEYCQDSTSLAEIDLVGSNKDGLNTIVQASADVKHLCVPVSSWSQNHKVINDVVGSYAVGSSIVFCETKAECNEVIDSKDITFDRRALHGDIPQALREKTMAAFREGKFRVLVATDVAARGIDCVVDLVVMNKPPATRSGWADTETYVHRSGRTGRAGRKGTCVTLYQLKHRDTLREIERATRNKFEWVAAPRARDVMGAAALAARLSVEAVDKTALPCFEEEATTLTKFFRSSDNAVKACLAKLAGYEGGKPPDRSLLTNTESYVTCAYAAGLQVHSISFVWNFLRQNLAPDVCDAFKGMQLVADSDGAVFDVPARHKSQLEGLDGVSVDVQELPRLKERASFQGKGRGGRGGGKGGRGRGRGGKGKGRGARRAW